jgi:hypothetical protein
MELEDLKYRYQTRPPIHFLHLKREIPADICISRINYKNHIQTKYNTRG